MAKLKIYNDIVCEEEKIFYQWFGMDAVCYKDIDAFAESIPKEDDIIDIHIYCNGGDVQEGLAIYDRLRQTGKTISTTVDGKAASLATLLMLVAPKERRFATENSTFLVHNPWIPGWGLGGRMTASSLKAASDSLQMWQDKMLDIYVERTGSDRDAMQALMDKDTWITAEQAISYGLLGSTLPPISASASDTIVKLINNNSKTMNKENVTIKASLVDKILAKLGVKSLEEVDTTAEDAKVVSMELNTADGQVITVERDEGEPQVGDKASPDGTFEMPDGKTIVIEDGVITDIKSPDTDENDGTSSSSTESTTDPSASDSQIAALAQQVSALTKERDELKTQLATAQSNARTREDLRVLNAVKMAGGAEKVLGVISSTYAPSKRTPTGKVQNTEAFEEDLVARYKARHK